MQVAKDKYEEALSCGHVTSLDLSTLYFTCTKLSIVMHFVYMYMKVEDIVIQHYVMSIIRVVVHLHCKYAQNTTSTLWLLLLILLP